MAVAPRRTQDGSSPGAQGAVGLRLLNLAVKKQHRQRQRPTTPAADGVQELAAPQRGHKATATQVHQPKQQRHEPEPERMVGTAHTSRLVYLFPEVHAGVGVEVLVLQPSREVVLLSSLAKRRCRSNPMSTSPKLVGLGRRSKRNAGRRPPQRRAAHTRMPDRW